MEICQIHRFHDKIAIYIGSGETVYFTPKQAAKIAKSLQDHVLDCKTKKFTSSSLATFRLED